MGGGKQKRKKTIREKKRDYTQGKIHFYKKRSAGGRGRRILNSQGKGRKRPRQWRTKDRDLNLGGSEGEKGRTGFVNE